MQVLVATPSDGRCIRAQLVVAALLAVALLLALAPTAVRARPVVSDYDLPITSLSPERHRAAITELVDAQRIAHGLKPLLPSGQLARSARSWAIFTRRNFGVLTHGDFARRAMRFPFVLGAMHGAHRYVGENLAFGSGGYSTPREIVRSWMRSPGHRANILRHWRYGSVWSSRSGDAVAVV